MRLGSATRFGWATRLSTCALAVVALGGCGDDPVAVEFQVIEEVEFAASLGIDLAMFTELPSGVYVKDVVVGTGDAAEVGDQVVVGYTGYVTDGSMFDAGSFPFELGSAGQAIGGFHEGVRGMQVGGERRVIIPPELGYGAQGLAGIIPPGSILIFDLTLDQVN
jgi:FKBP-type peptidyl-prolyl cis-trans isomerase